MIKVYYSYYKKNSYTSSQISNKYQDQKQNNLSNYAWHILENILKDYSIELNKDKIIYNSNGKPYLKEEQIYFNIAHSNDLVAIAVSDSEVGIDIEQIDNLSYMLENKIYEKWLDQRSIKDMLKEKNKLQYLTKEWVIRESLIKLFGESISINKMKKILNNNIEVNIELIDGYYMSVVNKKNEKITQLVKI